MINHPNRTRTSAKKPAAKKSAAMASVAQPRHDHEHDYSALLRSARASFAAATATATHLFQTDVAGLNDLYLDMLPAERQVHNCSCCRRFIESYGGLVVIDDRGVTQPVMWNPNEVPAFYHAAFAALFDRVQRARVTSVFVSNAVVWGNPETGAWSHLSVAPPSQMVYRERALTAGQATAAARENFRTVAAALADFKPQALDEALRILRAGALARSDKFIGPVGWLRALQDRPKGRLGENVLWREIAAAPEGYCHPRASVIGPLLEDIGSGLTFAEIKARFDAKLGPMVYQRPQAAPSVGNIKAAEDLVARLGIATALPRRFARLDEVQALWRPAAPMQIDAAKGVFGHIKPKNDGGIPSVDLPPVVMTWEKFRREGILKNAEAIEMLVPGSGQFVALTSSQDPAAPPILKWDRAEERNAVAWYVYPSGSPASQWMLRAGAWVAVEAIAAFPNMWGSRPMPFLTEGAVLILKGAIDSRSNAGIGLFPECLLAELHGARAVIEAYSRSAELGGREAASACGYTIRKGEAAGCTLRAFVKGTMAVYRIDRWD